MVQAPLNSTLFSLPLVKYNHLIATEHYSNYMEIVLLVLTSITHK